MTQPAVIVLERRPRWGPELERQFAGQDVRVRACRSVADLRKRLRQATTATVVVLDLASDPAGVLQFLSRRTGRAATEPVLVVAAPEMSELEWPARELGAVEFVSDEINGDDLAALCRRLWDR